MNVNGKPFRTIWVKPDDKKTIQIIDQRHLPHRFVIEDLKTPDAVETAIKEMHLRGAPLIGVAAAYGIYLALLRVPFNNLKTYLEQTTGRLLNTRPTAVNLAWALEKQLNAIKTQDSLRDKIRLAFKTANTIADEDVENCRKIGEHGVKVLKELWVKKNRQRLNILTHCNAGWLACVDYGTATSSIYAAHNQGMDIHVWVDETRPRNQGARLTAWELGQHGVPHTVIADNTGGHLMQHGLVDVVIVGSDRTTSRGDVANKVGTYLKALAAKDNNIPFYTALPSSSIDWSLEDGIKEIPIEERNSEEVRFITGLNDEGGIVRVRLTPEQSPASNYAFDVTPARLVTGLITERGICPASREGLAGLFPEHVLKRIKR
jgi:methylthioribose-1-phosphate isomerase